MAGFTAGVWKLSSYKQGYSEKQEPPLLSANDQKLEIHDGDSEVRYDVNLVAAGSLGIQPADDRLPPARWEGGGGTDAQKKFGEACKVTVLDAAGAVVAEQKGIRRNDAGKLSWLQVLPGHYVVRLELPGGETREEAADVTAGGQVQVHLAKK